MSNFIEKLKQVAAGRTKGKWDFHPAYGIRTSQLNKIGEPSLIANHLLYADGEFISAFANCFDELVELAESAKNYTDLCAEINRKIDTDADYDPEKDDIWTASRKWEAVEETLEKLRQKVEGEGG